MSTSVGCGNVEKCLDDEKACAESIPACLERGEVIDASGL